MALSLNPYGLCVGVTSDSNGCDILRTYFLFSFDGGVKGYFWVLSRCFYSCPFFGTFNFPGPNFIPRRVYFICPSAHEARTIFQEYFLVFSGTRFALVFYFGCLSLMCFVLRLLYRNRKQFPHSAFDSMLSEMGTQ